MSAKRSKISPDEDVAVTRFREYLRIKTVQPEPDYAKGLEFLARVAEELGLKTGSVEVLPGYVVFWMTWEGTQPTLPSLVLYSHTDVVPVDEEKWTYDPFAAHKDEDGKIFARGAQDMKNIGMQHVEAISRLKKAGKRFRRSIHLLFMPEEELGGFKGMQKFVHTEEFKKLNIGFHLDEGLSNPGDEMRVFYGERYIWWMEVRVGGNPGHGSGFLQNTVGPKLEYMMSKLLGLHAREQAKLDADPTVKVGDLFSVNLTQLEGGCQANVVPSLVSAVFDLRAPPHADIEAFERQLQEWCTEAGPDVTIHNIRKHGSRTMTSTEPEDKWWAAFSGACEEQGVTLRKEIFPAGTDARYMREMGIPALGFSPMHNLPILLHDHDEYIGEELFLRGCTIFEAIISRMADV